MPTNYHAILELPTNATEKEIREAYRRLAKKHHPDVNKSDNAHEQFVEIYEAYEHLINNLPQQKTFEYTQSEKDEIAEFQRLIRERAQQQAQKRHDDFVRKTEELKKSGFFDLVLFFKIISRVLAIPFVLSLFLFPCILAYLFNPFLLLLGLFSWPIAAFLTYFIYQQRIHYFSPEPFYYNFNRIKELFTITIPTNQKCFYCSTKNADSKPFHIELFKLKEIKLKNDGFRNQKANYMNDVAQIFIPRSRKAFIIHSIITAAKLTVILLSVIFLPFSSVLWRFIIAVFISEMVSQIILWVFQTKNNVSYLYNINFIIRLSAWFAIISSISTFDFDNHNIYISDFVFLTIFCILFFDCFFMQFIDYVIPKASYSSVVKQHSDIETKTTIGYRAYNDIPVISVVYPLWKWLWS